MAAAILPLSMSVGPFARARLNLLERSLLFTQDVCLRLGRGPTRTAHLQVGERGEVSAYFHVRRLGFTVVARQWRCAGLRGDLDLVAWDGETLCFVEVKTRSARDAFAAELAVDKDKRAMLRKMARAYMRQLDDAQQIAVRFYILTVYFAGERPEFELFRAAFGWSEPRPEQWY